MTESISTSMLNAMSALIAASMPDVSMLLLKTTVLLSVATAITLLMQRSSAARRHFVWYVALTSTLVLVVLQAVAPTIAVRVPANSILRVISSAGAVSSTALRPNDNTRSVSANAEHNESTSTQQNGAPSVARRTEPARRPQVVRQMVVASSGYISSPRTSTSKIIPAAECGQFAARPTSASRDANCVSLQPVVGQEHSAGVIVALLWMCGVVVMLMRFVVAHIRLAQLTRSAQPLKDNAWLHDAHTASTASGASAPRLLLHADVATPFTAGWLHPVIVLPHSALQYDAQRRRAVITHELAHIARGDYVALCVAALATALYWFHPLVWMAARCARNESERAADDSVIKAGMSAVQYAEHLLALADQRSQQLVHSVAPGMARASQLEWRLRSMLDTTKSRAGVSKMFARAGRALSLLALVPLAGLRTQVGDSLHGETHRALLNTTHSSTRVPDKSNDEQGVFAQSASAVPSKNVLHQLPTLLRNNLDTPRVQNHELDNRGRSLLNEAQVFASATHVDATTPILPSPATRSGSDTAYEKTLNARDSVAIFLDTEVGGGVNLFRRKETTITVRAALPSSLAGITMDGSTDSVNVHTFSSDGAKGYTGINKFTIDLYIPFNARVTWRTHSAAGTRTMTNVGGRIRVRGVSSQNPTAFDSAMIPPALDTTSTLVKPAQLRDTIFEQSVAAESGKTFNLNLPYGGDVVIHGWDEPRIRMNATLTTRFGEGMRPTLMTVAPGFQLVTYRDPRAAYEPLTWALDSAMINGHMTYAGKYRGNHYEFWVPRHTNIVLSSTGGSVTISDVDGDLSGKTDYGFVDVRNAHGSMNLRTIVGSINVLNSTLAGVSSTQCGDVNAAQLGGALQLKTADGVRTASIDGVPDEVVVNSDHSFTVRMRACSGNWKRF